MPTLPIDLMLSVCIVGEAEIVRACFHGGRLRATKPFKRPATIFHACVNYIWRYLCFIYVARRPHSFRPHRPANDLYHVTRFITAQLPVVRENRDAMDGLLTRIERTVPSCLQASFLRGAPQ